MAVQGNLQRSAVGGTPGAVYGLIGLAIAAIWVAVGAATIFAPDMITGSQHDHLPIAGWTYWLWGLIATGSVLLAAMRGVRAQVSTLAPWVALAAAVAVIWVGVALVGIFAPVFVTGTDPTTLPIATLVAPIVGVIVTAGICKFFEAAAEP